MSVAQSLTETAVTFHLHLCVLYLYVLRLYVLCLYVLRLCVLWHSGRISGEIICDSVQRPWSCLFIYE